MRKEQVEKNSRDVAWAIFLIFVGTIFLLNTTGVVGWGIWTYILRFWPVLLILAGIKLVVGKSAIAELVVSIVALILFVFVGTFAYALYSSREIPFLPTSVKECIMGRCGSLAPTKEKVEKEMLIAESEYTEEINSRELELNIGAAYFELLDGDISEYLSIHSQYPSHFGDPKLESTLNGDRLSMQFDSASINGFVMFNTETSRYDFILGQRDLLTDLNISLGAGEGLVNLDEVILGDVFVRVGAGELVLDLGERSVPSEKISIEVGAGELVLQLPEGVGYSLEYDLGIGSIVGDGSDISTFIGSEKNYESENYDSAQLKVRIVANVGVGSLVINTK